MNNSNRKRPTRKPGPDWTAKPYPDFPLTPHACGRWQKKILGKTCYFGRWGRIRDGKMERLPGDGWKEALDIYKAQKDDLYAGRTPRVKRVGEGLTLAELGNRFLTAMLKRKQRGKMTALTFAEYQKTTDLLIAHFGKQHLIDDLETEDFESLLDTMAQRWGLVRLGNEITRVKSVFKYGHKNIKRMDEVKFGTEFTKPSADELRKHKAKNGNRMLEADQLRRWLDALEGKEVVTGTDKKTGRPIKVKMEPDPVLRAMVLLGVNCGFIGKDCADLSFNALDLARGWIDFPRPKTGVDRRCSLWPETVASLEKAIAVRPEPRHAAAERSVFVTTRGRPYLSKGQANPVSVLARDAMKAVKIHRPGIGFATLRHVFRTIADRTRDIVAIRHTMGRSDIALDLRAVRLAENGRGIRV